MTTAPALTDWTLREAGARDAEALALVGAASFLESYAGLVDGQAIIAHCAEHHSAEAYRALLSEGARAWLVELEPGAAPIGYALTSAPTLEQAEAGDRELRRIYVLSRFHGTGLAQALLEAVTAASQGCARLLLGVKEDNHRALAFYRKQGFAEIGTRRFTVGGKTYDDFVLALPLT